MTVSLHALHLCFEGVIPAVIATASADGCPNITYLSRVQQVDDERIAVSNQFFSKTQRNLAENPRASVLLIDPMTFDEYRLTLVYERTERRGPVFERLRADVDQIAALTGMADVFKLRAADIYRVLHIDQVPSGGFGSPRTGDAVPPLRTLAEQGAPLAELSARISRSPDLNTIVATTVRGLSELLGYEHSLLLLLDEDGRRLYTIASHGYEQEGVGSEVIVGEGIIGMAASRAATIRMGNLRQMAKYSKGIRQAFEEHDEIGPGHEIPVPGLPNADSGVAVPAIAMGQVVGVLVVEDLRPAAYSEADESVLSIIASLVANAIEVDRELADESASVPHRRVAALDPATPTTHVRFFAVDGSTFLDGDYLIKGVAGRILWSLLGHYQSEQRVEFTNKEVRLDPSLELPEFRDNLDSRLLLLKRRLDERDAPIRIEKTGRGRFQLQVAAALRLDSN